MENNFKKYLISILSFNAIIIVVLYVLYFNLKDSITNQIAIGILTGMGAGLTMWMLDKHYLNENKKEIKRERIELIKEAMLELEIVEMENGKEIKNKWKLQKIEK